MQKRPNVFRCGSGVQAIQTGSEGLRGALDTFAVV